MKLWDIIKIVSGILIVKAGCKIIDTAYVYITDDRTRTALFNEIKKDQAETIDTKEIEDDTIIMGFQA